MTIEDFHTNIRTYLNPGSGRHFTPEQIDAAINGGVSDLLYAEMAAFEKHQVITDTLGFFKSKEEKNVSSGLVDLPATMHFITDLEAVLSDNTRRHLDQVKDESWTTIKNSVAFAPTARNPKARQANGKLEVLPVVATGVVGVSKVVYYFIRKPAVGKFNYDEEAGYGFAYKSDGSVQLDWPEIDHNKIMLKALGYLGIPTSNTLAIQAEKIKQS